MKMLIQTENDLKQLQGKFILQINSEAPDMQLMDFNWEFTRAKRLKLVSGIGVIDLYGARLDFKDFESFKNYFNSYLFNHMILRGDIDGGRFHRLLTAKELSYLFEKIKLENY